MPSAQERFRAKVQRRGSHELWTGFIDHRGVGMVRINGKLRTVQRAAWEFAHGPLAHDVRVNTCADQRACVRVDHLSVEPPLNVQPKQPMRIRRPRGTGSKRELRPGVWQLAAVDSGVSARRYGTFYGNAEDAEAALHSFVARVRRDLGDLRVRELIGRFLYAEHTLSSPSFQRNEGVLHDVIEPTFGDHLAAALTDADVEAALTRAYRDHGSDTTRSALGLTRDAYQWARRQDWTDSNPTSGITLRSLR